MITVRYAREAPRDPPGKGGRKSGAGESSDSAAGAPFGPASTGRSAQETSGGRAGRAASGAVSGSPDNASGALTYSQPTPGGANRGGRGEPQWPDALDAEPTPQAGLTRPVLEPSQWKSLDAYAPAAVDALLAVAARTGDAVMLDAARASGLVGETLEESESGTAVPRRIRAVWRLLCANAQHQSIADEWLGRALVESPGAVVRLLLDIDASDWTSLAAAVLAAGVDPWMPLPGDETRIAWGEVPGVALESPSIVALALARGLGPGDVSTSGPSALRVLAPRPRAGVPMVGLLHDPRQREQHGRPVDFFEAILSCYERRPIPESEVAFAFGLVDASAKPEPDDLLAQANAELGGQGALPAADAAPTAPKVVPPYGTIDVPAKPSTKPLSPLEASLQAALDAGMSPIAARIALRAAVLLATYLRDPAELAGVAPVSGLERPETVDSLRRHRWLLITRLAALAGPAARSDPALAGHDRARLVPWPLVSVVAAGSPPRGTRAESQADDRRAAAALRSIAKAGFDPDAVDSMGRSALLLACRRPDRAETVRTLLDWGANCNHVDGRGQDASSYARHGGNVQVIAAIRNAQARAVLERLRGPEFE